MQELIQEMLRKGLTEKQALSSIATVQVWLEKNYPVAGTLAASWTKHENIPVTGEFLPL